MELDAEIQELKVDIKTNELLPTLDEIDDMMNDYSSSMGLTQNEARKLVDDLVRWNFSLQIVKEDQRFLA